jgi:uncharacterized lipoprotein YddW (UPF0748 family)
VRHVCLAVVLAILRSVADAQEFRALWADTFHAGLRNGTETTALVAAARAAKCNAVVVEVRKRGDAYYRNGLEPVATDVAAGFDPLADLIDKAHDTSAGQQRIEVHAWFVTYNVWNNQGTPPSQAAHPYNLHPDWLTQNNTGATWDGGNYQFDQGHPEVQRHTYNVLMDVLNRYDVDGIHFDYIRYSDGGSSGNNQPWGYNPVSVARFKQQTGTSTIPTPTNAAWLQWRRDQVTALVRKVYLNAWAAKPDVRVSASLITYGNAPANLNLSSWQASEAYSRVLQDWRGWLEEGILDLGCPMAYKTSNTSFSGWTNFIRERQYGRASAIGMGWYLNPMSQTLAQIDIARTSGTNGVKAAGVLGYSYAVPDNDNTTPHGDAWASLANGPFASIAAVPPMPWKSNTAAGHLMGFALDGAGAAFDGATVTVSGPVNRTLKTDATGFFGAVGLPVGSYTITISVPGYIPVMKTVTVSGAQVTEQTLTLESKPFAITSVAAGPTVGALTITWNSAPQKAYRVERSANLARWFIVSSGVPSGGTSTSFPWQPPDGSTMGFLRVREE